MDSTDRQLLNLLQTRFPLVERPFAELGKDAGIDEGEVLARVSALRSPPRPLIRQISAIFDTKALGYQSSLVAARVEEDRVESAVAAINAHPGVTHNYLRNHAFNIWYTVAVPPDSHLGLERTVQVLHERSGALSTRLFPTLRLFKIGVAFDLTGGTDAAARDEGSAFDEDQRQRAMTFAVTDRDKRMMRVLQQDLPAEPRPFDAWAAQAGVSVAELLEAAAEYREQGRMRRFAAVLHHRAAGFSANGMGAWNVPEGEREEFGRTAATFSAVSHCYLRPTYADWPYAIFTMVHGKTREECDASLAAIAEATGVRDYVALYSSREFKKTRLKYFLGEVEAWEQGT